MGALQDLLASLRGQGDALLRTTDDPHAELLAMVWGSRFDREHAHGLLARQPQALPEALRTVLAAADRFDALSAPRQQRLRQLIVKHHGGPHRSQVGGQGQWDNRLHAPHPAD